MMNFLPGLQAPLTLIFMLISIYSGSLYLTLLCILPIFIGLLTDEVKSYSIHTILQLIFINTLYYLEFFYLKKFYASEWMLFGVLVTINLLIAIFYSIFFNRIDKIEKSAAKSIIDKFEKEHREIAKKEADMNTKLKDYKLDFSQKISVIRKFLELTNNNSPDTLENAISLLKNILGIKKYIFFKYSEEKNSFIKIKEEFIELSEIKGSHFLKWVLERALCFPKNINILTHDTMSKNPDFSHIFKEDTLLPKLFIPIKKDRFLKGFILIYEFSKENDNEYRALSHLISEIFITVLEKKLI